jgi:hypothetical protein
MILVAAHHVTPTTCTPRYKQTWFSTWNKDKGKTTETSQIQIQTKVSQLLITIILRCWPLGFSKNHYQHHVGAAPLPETYHNEKKASTYKDSNPKKNGRSAKRRRNRQKNRKLSKMMKKDCASSKGNSVQCKACWAFMHTAEKFHTPKHLVALY